jgi:uncharacterized lipoprotein YmbA
MNLSRPHFSICAPLACFTLAALLLGGCKILPEATSDPTRYYVLSGPASAELSATKPAGTHQIGLRPVELPGYLHNHKDMVVRTGANELRFQEFALWAEPLETGVNHILKEQLLAADTIGSVTTYPFSVDVKRDYDVVVRVVNCEGLVQGARSGVARFAATYDIIAAGAGGQVIVRRTFTAPDQSWDGTNFSALARLLSDDIAKLSNDIAANMPK